MKHATTGFAVCDAANDYEPEDTIPDTNTLSSGKC